MKIILFFFVFSSSIFSADAQIVNDYYGAIKLNDTSVITYRINFKIVDNILSGYSMTDISGEHETKSIITGKYDKENELISFNETGIIYTKSPVSQNDFCNVYFLPSKFKLGKSKLLKGNFDGRFSDGTKCIDGEILLNSVEQVKKRIEKVSKKVNKSKRVADSIKEKFNNIKILKAANTNYLKKNEITSVFTKSKTINLYIYDGGKIDNDVITILKDGKIVLFKHVASKTKKHVVIPIESEYTRITILSVSEGSIELNTTVIEVNDSLNKINTVTNLKEGEKTEIDIINR